MSRNKIMYLSIIICVVLEAFFGTKYFLLTKDMIEFNKINMKLNDLKNINEKLDLIFLKKLQLINFDEVDIFINEFNQVFNSIPKYSLSKDIFLKDYAKKIESIKIEFNKVSGNIKEFEMLNSKLLIVMQRINETFLKLKNPDKFAKFYYSLLMLDFKNKQYCINLLKEVSAFKAMNSIENDFLTFSTSLLNGYLSLNEISISQNLVLQRIKDIQFNILYFLDGGYFNLSYIMFFVFLGFAISLCFCIYLKSLLSKRDNDVGNFKKIIDNAFSSVMITNLKSKIEYVNKSFYEMTKYKENEVIGKNAQILRSDRHSDIFWANVKKTMLNDKIFEQYELSDFDKNKKEIFYKLRAIGLRNDKKIDKFAFIKLDQANDRAFQRIITAKNIEIEGQIYTDSLTKVGNALALNTMLDAKIPGIIIYININNFTNLRFFYKTKVINDILISFCETLSLCIDTYKINAKIFRLQMDEFVLLYEGDNLKEDINTINTYLNFKIFKLRQQNGFEIVAPLKITFGISTDKDSLTNDRLYQATLAHHEARAQNETIGYYKDENLIEKKYYENQLITNKIQYALNNNKVIVEAQGVFDLSKEEIKIKYYEVLMRIIDDKNKICYPGEFLDVAKKTSLYIPLTKVLIKEVFNLIKRFKNTHFSINLSSLDISNQNLRNCFLEELENCERSENLCIEILESESIDDYKVINNFIKIVKKYNCKIAIDDFGSGYSNYYRILTLDIDYIKIDGSIIKNIATDEKAYAVVETIINFASKQGYDVIAEYVSNREILNILKKLGIKYVQGYLFAKPISPDQIII